MVYVFVLAGWMMAKKKNKKLDDVALDQRVSAEVREYLYEDIQQMQRHCDRDIPVSTAIRECTNHTNVILGFRQAALLLPEDADFLLYEVKVVMRRFFIKKYNIKSISE